MNVVAIGAHPDDVVLGVGGTVARHCRDDDQVTFVVVTSGSEGGATATRRREEVEAGADRLGVEDVYFLHFEDTRIPYDDALVKAIEGVLRDADADRVYTHAEADTHQDHRKTALGTLAAARDVPEVYGYESPSTLPSFSPNAFVTFDEDALVRKIEAIENHESQFDKDALDGTWTESLARVRGRQANARFAEGFEAVRSVETLN